MTAPAMIWRLATAGAVFAALLAGCSSGRDAVAQGGTFEFVSPGGKTDISYDPPSARGRPGPLSGPDLADPAHTLSLDDPIFAGRSSSSTSGGSGAGRAGPR